MFGALDSVHSVRLGLAVAATVALTGVTTGACAYLVAERILRKPASRALADEDPGRLRVPGVATRAVLAWAFGCGVPVLGVVLVGVATLAGSPATEAQLERVMIALGMIAVLVGLLAVMLAARATADPVDAVRRAMERVQAGSLDVRVPIYDGTQVGRLQLGFNRMAAGLAEREQAHTRETGDALLLTEDTRERLSAPPDGLRRRDGVALRGRSEPIALYAL